MSYPTAFLNREKPKQTEVIITDAQIIDEKYMVYVVGKGWMKFWFMNFDQPTSFQDLINDIQAAEAHEFIHDLEEMRVS